jgi:hypothetical protein
LNSGPPEYEARMLTSISRMRKVEDEKCIWNVSRISRQKTALDTEV